MLVENQLVEVQWNNNTKAWYESKGYNFTHAFDKFYVHPIDLPERSGKKVRVICDYCRQEYITSYVVYNDGIKHNGKNACRYCAAIKSRTLDYEKRKNHNWKRLRELCDKYGYKLITSEEEYHDIKQKIQYVCPLHGIQTAIIDSFLRGGTCHKCKIDDSLNSTIVYSLDEVKSIVESKNGNLILNLSEYIDAKRKNLIIKCGSCNNIFLSSLNDIIKGGGRCSDCAVKAQSSRRLSVSQVEQIVNNINNNILLNKNDYINSTTHNLRVKCGSCGEVFVSNLSLIRKSVTGGCKKCSPSSIGEEIIAKILDDYIIKYTRQEDFDGDCHDKNGMPFDFYLPDYNLCIEFDGIHHYEPIYGEEPFKIRKLHDAMKDWYCRWNNINLLRIPYWEQDNIHQILINELHLSLDKTKIRTNKIKYIHTKIA